MMAEAIYDEVTINKDTNVAAVLIMALAVVFFIWLYTMFNINYASDSSVMIQTKTEVQAAENSIIMITDTVSWKKGW